MDTGFPTVVWRLCLGPGCAWFWFSVTPPALAGVLGGCVLVRFVVSTLYSPLGLAVFAVGPGFWPAPHLSWLGFWDVRGCVRALPASRRSRFWCAVSAFVLGSRFRLRPASPWGGVGVCVCLCARPAWSPAPPGWGCGAGVCGWAWAAAAPRDSFLGCWGVCVFVCAPRLYPAFPGWAVLCGRVCRARVSAVSRPSWLGSWGVRALVRLPCLSSPFLGGRLRRGGVRVLPLVGIAPPPLPFNFFWGGALWCRSLVVRVLGLMVSVPPFLLFRAAFFFFPSQRGVRPRFLDVPSPCGPLPPAWCCRSWLGGPPVPLWGVLSSLPSGSGSWPPLVVFVGASVAVGRSRAPPPHLGLFSGGSACFSLCLHWAGARTGRHSVWLSGLLLVVAFCQAVPQPHGSGGYLHVGLCAHSCWIRFWLCRLGGCARWLRVAPG